MAVSWKQLLVVACVGMALLSPSKAAAKIERFKDKEGNLHITNTSEEPVKAGGLTTPTPAPAALPVPPAPVRPQVVPPPGVPPAAAPAPPEPVPPPPAGPADPPPVRTPESNEPQVEPPQEQPAPEAGNEESRNQTGPKGAAVSEIPAKKGRSWGQLGR